MKSIRYIHIVCFVVLSSAFRVVPGTTDSAPPGVPSIKDSGQGFANVSAVTMEPRSKLVALVVDVVARGESAERFGARSGLKVDSIEPGRWTTFKAESGSAVIDLYHGKDRKGVSSASITFPYVDKSGFFLKNAMALWGAYRPVHEGKTSSVSFRTEIAGRHMYIGVSLFTSRIVMEAPVTDVRIRFDTMDQETPRK